MDNESEDKKDIIFYYLDTLFETIDVEERFNVNGDLSSYGSYKFFILFPTKNDLWFSRNESKLIMEMFDISWKELEECLIEYFSKKFNARILDNIILF